MWIIVEHVEMSGAGVRRWYTVEHVESVTL